MPVIHDTSGAVNLKVQMAPLSRRPQEPSDFLFLYLSLSRDSVLPQGFAKAFSGVFAYVLGLRIVVRAVTSVLAP